MLRKKLSEGVKATVERSTRPFSSVSNIPESIGYLSKAWSTPRYPRLPYPEG